MSCKIFLRLLISRFLLGFVISIQYGDKRLSDNLRSCNSIPKCKIKEPCYSRTIQCDNPPCPMMLFCEEEGIDDFESPRTCENVQCPNGWNCKVIVQQCSWKHSCKIEYAICISDYEYFEGPATCGEYKCSTGKSCILRESQCKFSPCKLIQRCINTEDVDKYLDRCKSLNCLSKHECFMRKNDDKCNGINCKYNPDCIATSEKELAAYGKCQGWICPKEHECIANIIEPCVNYNCKIIRSCRPIKKTIDNPINEILSNNEEIDSQVRRVSTISHMDKNEKEIDKIISNNNFLFDAKPSISQKNSPIDKNTSEDDKYKELIEIEGILYKIVDYDGSPENSK